MEYGEIKELIEIFEKTDLNDMEVMLGNDRLRLNRSPVSPFQAVPVPPMPPSPVEVSSEKKENEPGATTKETEKKADFKEEKPESGKVIKAPIVGTFYRSSAPNADPFIKEGDSVSVGDVVCIIEAMKFMNEVNSEISGKVVEILAEDGAFVEYGQELFRLV